ncbi:hypothetical protein BH23BAC2_BH23BAC2_24510 [soil metagenome]
MLKYQALQRKNYGNVNLAAICFFLFLGTGCFSQERQLDVGLRFQKTVNLYYENGVTFQYTDDRLLSQRLFLGLSYVTSRLGSAMGTNAIKQDNFILSSTYIFRPQRNLQPFLRLNTGYFIADYEEPIFDVLPNTSFLLSPEAGLGYKFKNPLKANASLGYNLITGDGIDGAGTLYPLFIQTSITWNVLAKKKDHETAF